MIEAIEAALRPTKTPLEIDGFDLKVEGVMMGLSL